MLNERDIQGHARSSDDSERLQTRIEAAQEEVRAIEQVCPNTVLIENAKQLTNIACVATRLYTDIA